ncbi:hypothetical protein VTJ04DRAFT_6414 [Mycothermus thermophilus]|uniref:uncharacterized protein n=1 Tax=Humicola insolens TaxID=85995 RepID=UPI0037421681
MAKTTSNWQVIQCHESLHTIRREVKEWKEEKTKDGPVPPGSGPNPIQITFSLQNVKFPDETKEYPPRYKRNQTSLAPKF